MSSIFELGTVAQLLLEAALDTPELWLFLNFFRLCLAACAFSGIQVHRAMHKHTRAWKTRLGSLCSLSSGFVRSLARLFESPCAVYALLQLDFSG